MSSNIKAALKNIKPKVASKSGITQRVAQMLDEMNQFDTVEGLGNMEVMGFSYQKADKEGSKKS